MIKFQSFLSSSSGNATFLTDDETRILIDCGATGTYIERCLACIGTSADALSAILLTHAHSDHVGAAGVLSRKFSLPIYATKSTFENANRNLGVISPEHKKILSPGDELVLGNMQIRVFSLPHDAEGAVSFTFSDADGKFGIATDLGFVSDEILENLSGADTVIVEANHDIEMLKGGPYPYPLKQRILSDGGHLSNEACGALCVALAKTGTKSFWLGHLSQHNNLPELAYSAVRNALLENGFTVGGDVAVNVLPKTWMGENV